FPSFSYTNVITVLSGTASAGIFIFSGILFPFLYGRQSTGGRYVRLYHCKPKLNAVTNSIRPVLILFLSLNNGLILSLCQKRKPISEVSNTSFKKETSGVIGMQSPKQPQFLNLPDR